MLRSPYPCLVSLVALATSAGCGSLSIVRGQDGGETLEEQFGPPDPPAARDCPRYTPFNHPVGSRFDFQNEGFDPSAPSTSTFWIDRKRRKPDETLVEWREAYVDASGEGTTLWIYRCDDEGAWLIQAENSHRSIVEGEVRDSGYTKNYEGYRTMIPGHLGLGDAWEITYTEKTRASDSPRSTSTHNLRFGVLAERSFTVPAGTFEGLAIEWGTGRRIHLYAPHLGRIGGDGNQLQSYALP